MKKALPFIVVIIIIAVIVGIAVGGGDDNNNSTNPPATSNTTNNSNTPQNSGSTSTAPQATNSVTIANMSFSPADITVKKGTTVTWTNNDSIAHTVTADTDTEHGPNSDTINPGDTYTFTFTDDGTFAYHCSIHPEMTGKVTVTE